MGNMKANSKNAGRVVAAVLDELGREERQTVVKGEKWIGTATGMAMGITGVEGRGKEAVERLKWLFEGYF